MENLGLNRALLFFQILNLALLALALGLDFLALRRLWRWNPSPMQLILWAALILFVPILGALVFLASGKERG